ncbi:TIGR01777 family oxidoreductase [Imperialibacter roseus]|uniref:TIGR01777 family oxidoreductase n=1 Tax=Imperialibacter roseus TaxID=1324217 RepID=A0ABZ0IN53_9BACT|nr:TIGR01777 family oxidoreductase [Imperialibacter roseus]WOK05966.1 TIGR01777 family oxidoreductase [Imperialibacter roseus]
MRETTKGKILVTGGSGLIGSRLSELLTQAGYEVAWLSRSSGKADKYKTYTWDIERGEIQHDALEGVEAIVHLAGAGVADKSWTEARKKLILESRTQSTALLMEKLSALERKPKVFIGASAIGYYGADTGDVMIDEKSPAGDDFLAQVVKSWEASSAPVEGMGSRRVLIRVGVVLSASGGALPQLLAPLKFGLGAPLGTGRQWMSWIHIDDLCRLFLEAIENTAYTGVYNGVSPSPATNKEITTEAAKVLKKPLWLPPVPGFVLKVALGEMAQIVLGGSKISSRKAEEMGFKFDYTHLNSALKNILLK